ncbi:hemagglutinin repeat-containing protein [Paraburkholderia humisilvae]|uniref:hemagglutinin repeat-containing protein n=1 Tax=Paraburkholderia humisilvae TaxID=627669 RepID=UPI00248418C6|nr:hemagglutinin repeat-containing protein [Paraburkholderia humisilvae]
MSGFCAFHETGFQFRRRAGAQISVRVGSGMTWTNTHINAGNTLTLLSDGDTNLIGAVFHIFVSPD